MENEYALKLELSFKLKISVPPFPSFDERISNFESVICQSKNKQFLAFKYLQKLYIIKGKNKIILQFKSKISNCCFSEDSKYCAIFLHDKYKLLILYNLEELNMVFLNKIIFFKQFHLDQKLNFYQDQILMTSVKTIQSYSLNGEEQLQLERDSNHQNIHIKLNEKLLVLSHLKYHENNSKDELEIFSSQNCKKLSTFAFISKVEKTYTFSQNLLFFIPFLNSFLLILREITTHKIIRKYKHKSKSYFRPLFQTDRLKNEIRGFDLKQFYKINISKGCIHAYKGEYPIYPEIVFGYLEKGVPIFTVRDGKVWKKDHSQNKNQLKFYEMKF